MKNKKLWFSVTAADCDFQTFRATGKGGQHRNKTESAVRCVHRNSGATGECTEHREQGRNKKIAFRRMAESKEFQAWLGMKIDAGLNKIDIEYTDDYGNKVKRKVNMDEV